MLIVTKLDFVILNYIMYMFKIICSSTLRVYMIITLFSLNNIHYLLESYYNGTHTGLAMV